MFAMCCNVIFIIFFLVGALLKLQSILMTNENSFSHQLFFAFNKNISGILIPLFPQVHSLTETFLSS